MRTFTQRNKWDWLIVQRKWRFYNLYSWTTLFSKNVWFWLLTNPIANSVMDVLEKNWLSYIIWWYNNDEIAIYNHEKKIIVSKWKRSYSSWTYWIKRINHEALVVFDSSAIKYPYFTIFKWNDIYEIIISSIEWWFVMENEIVPNKSWWLSKIKLNEKEKIIYRQAVMYSKRIVSLSSKFDVTMEDMNELANYSDVDVYRAEMIVNELKNNYNATLAKLRSQAIWKKTYKEIINSFI